MDIWFKTRDAHCLGTWYVHTLFVECAMIVRRIHTIWVCDSYWKDICLGDIIDAWCAQSRMGKVWGAGWAHIKYTDTERMGAACWDAQRVHERRT